MIARTYHDPSRVDALVRDVFDGNAEAGRRALASAVLYECSPVILDQGENQSGIRWSGSLESGRPVAIEVLFLESIDYLNLRIHHIDGDRSEASQLFDRILKCAERIAPPGMGGLSAALANGRPPTEEDTELPF